MIIINTKGLSLKDSPIIFSAGILVYEILNEPFVITFVSSTGKGHRFPLNVPVTTVIVIEVILTVKMFAMARYIHPGFVLSSVA